MDDGHRPTEQSGWLLALGRGAFADTRHGHFRSSYLMSLCVSAHSVCAHVCAHEHLRVRVSLLTRTCLEGERDHNEEYDVSYSCTPLVFLYLFQHLD